MRKASNFGNGHIALAQQYGFAFSQVGEIARKMGFKLTHVDSHHDIQMGHAVDEVNRMGAKKF